MLMATLEDRMMFKLPTTPFCRLCLRLRLRLNTGLAALLLAGVAQAQSLGTPPASMDPAIAAAMPRYTLRADMAHVGSNIPRIIMRDSLVPFNLSWQALSPAQQQVMKSYYEDMPEADEPPFPRNGLRAVLEPAVKVASATGDQGQVTMELNIDSRGQVVSVAVATSPSKAYTQALARAMLDVSFKPALCGGQPCRMAFPVQVFLERELR